MRHITRLYLGILLLLENSLSSTLDDVQFVDITDGKDASAEVLLFDDVDPFLRYDSSSKKMRGKKLTVRHKNKRKFEGKSDKKSMVSLSYEEKLDTVFDVLLTRSTQTSRQTNRIFGIMAIMSTFLGFVKGSIGYLEALEVFLKKPARHNFMVPKTDGTKIDLLKRLIEKVK
uniref:Uncharacterized protein n=1 Tax=Lactuca sativa TaxID=4236 RepID=A0A9R1W8D3_LACSA|nr:hypothetical protein LSAT_V11C300132130 [Lactuca sativa]